MSSYGFTCWGSAGHYGGCGHSLEFPDLTSEGYDGEVQNEAERRAGMAGWRIGHLDGQAYIVCPCCHEAVWDAVPLGRDDAVLSAITDIARVFGCLLAPDPTRALTRYRKFKAGKLGPRRRGYRSRLSDMNTETLRRMLGYCDHKALHRPVTGHAGRRINADYRRLQRRVVGVLRARGEPTTAIVGKIRYDRHSDLT